MGLGTLLLQLILLLSQQCSFLFGGDGIRGLRAAARNRRTHGFGKQAVFRVEVLKQRVFALH